jgi:tRNA U34 5-carboxymethylaminomethyl modifying enzyme MnmG/GidA
LDTHAITTDQINSKGELIIRGTILNNGSFLKGAMSIGDKQVSVDRVGTNSLRLEISENNYPRLTKLADFTFNDCHM